MNNTPHSALSSIHLMIGVTGGIAAYKIPYLVRGLVKQGADVRVVMTRNARHFVAPLSLQTLSGKSVLAEMFESDTDPPMAHIEWTREIDLMLITPATANFIGKMANGIADDLLSTMILTIEAPIVIAPSMNSRMYKHPAVVQNLNRLRERGVHILEPESGDLACGEEGIGRMAEVDTIIRFIRERLIPAGPLSGKKLIVTAGPTVEPIDPVRFISNRSSGKMGYALAREARRMGGDVTLVSGPTSLNSPEGVRFIPVQTALEMQEQVESLFSDTDILIMAAAVGDFAAAEGSREKIKKGNGPLSLQLVANPDILKVLSTQRGAQVLVGFAAETENVKEEALKKLGQKGVDLMVANDVSGKEAGFGSDKNRVMIVGRNGIQEETDLLPKHEIARIILKRICRDFI
jgi:phosphopantothenoylcysteine decarboxylase/phosphopantothenate--cysteine ligase